MENNKTASLPLIGKVISCIIHKDECKSLKEYVHDMTVTAHTGCMGTNDNSLEAITEGAKYADIVEFDIRFDNNGTPVLSHDAPKGNEVTFEEAVKLLKTLPDLKINIDIKSTDNLSAVVEIAKKYDIFPRIFFTGVDSKFVDAVREQTKDVPYYLNVSVKKRKNKKPDYLASLVDTVKKAGAVGINFNRKTASKELVEAFHEAGLLVSIWTVNKKKDMYKIYSYMPDNMTTRNPDILRHEIDIIK